MFFGEQLTNFYQHPGCNKVSVMRKVAITKRSLRTHKRARRRACKGRGRRKHQGQQRYREGAAVGSAEYVEYEEDDGQGFAWGFFGPGYGGAASHFSGDFGDVSEYQARGSAVDGSCTRSDFAALLPLRAANEGESGADSPPETR